MPASRWLWLPILLLLVLIRWSKGALLTDVYALISRPFWPGSAQREWLRSARQVEDQVRLSQLEQDNQRLRRLLEIQRESEESVSAPVISRNPAGWWQQLVLGRGSLQSLAPGQAVIAPGGLIGLVSSVTPTTATVVLLSDPGSRVGVWVGRTQRHGLLIGSGTSRPRLQFFDKDPLPRPGDVVVTSPASTVVPPNLPVGVIQSVKADADPAPEAIVQLSAPVEAVDWVEVRLR
jgi:rod shape-determining protein MreC